MEIHPPGEAIGDPPAASASPSMRWPMRAADPTSSRPKSFPDIFSSAFIGAFYLRMSVNGGSMSEQIQCKASQGNSLGNSLGCLLVTFVANYSACGQPKPLRFVVDRRGAIRGLTGDVDASGPSVRACLFLAYSVHQLPATTDNRKLLEAGRKLTWERKLSSIRQDASSLASFCRETRLFSRLLHALSRTPLCKSLQSLNTDSAPRRQQAVGCGKTEFRDRN